MVPIDNIWCNSHPIYMRTCEVYCFVWHVKAAALTKSETATQRWPITPTSFIIARHKMQMQIQTALLFEKKMYEQPSFVCVASTKCWNDEMLRITSFLGYSRGVATTEGHNQIVPKCELTFRCRFSLKNIFIKFFFCSFLLLRFLLENMDELHIRWRVTHRPIQLAIVMLIERITFDNQHAVNIRGSAVLKANKLTWDELKWIYHSRTWQFSLLLTVRESTRSVLSIEKLKMRIGSEKEHGSENCHYHVHR